MPIEPMVADAPAPPRFSDQSKKDFTRRFPKAVVIGASTGGPALLKELMSQVEAGAEASFFVVQHLPAKFVVTLVACLRSVCRMPVIEASPGLRISTGVCYVAAGNRHLVVRKTNMGEPVIETPAYPQTPFMPSVDITMKSVAGIYGASSVGVIMTGMGEDGFQGMRHILQSGGQTIVQDEKTASEPEMPRAVARRGLAQSIVPGSHLACAIQNSISAI